VQNNGVGGSLLKAVEKKVREWGGKRICPITTNDNLSALRFYQKRGDGFPLPRGGRRSAQNKKPSIPLVGNEGIALDEIELEKRLLEEGGPPLKQRHKQLAHRMHRAWNEERKVRS
jgi:hypothetical protein